MKKKEPHPRRRKQTSPKHKKGMPAPSTRAAPCAPQTCSATGRGAAPVRSGEPPPSFLDLQRRDVLALRHRRRRQPPPPAEPEDPLDVPIASLYEDINPRLLNGLEAMGVLTPKEMLCYTREQVLQGARVTKVSLDALLDVLISRGVPKNLLAELREQAARYSYVRASVFDL